MQIGMIGLGRMGANMARRLMKGGHKCVVYDRNAETVDALARDGHVGDIREYRMREFEHVVLGEVAEVTRVAERVHAALVLLLTVALLR